MTSFLLPRNNGDLEDLRTLDLQVMRVTSPALDILYFLNTSTDPKIRKTHFTEWLKIYHDKLTSCLKDLGHDTKVLYPFESLMKDIKECGGFGYFVGVFIAQVKIT